MERPSPGKKFRKASPRKKVCQTFVEPRQDLDAAVVGTHIVQYFVHKTPGDQSNNL